MPAFQLAVVLMRFAGFVVLLVYAAPSLVQHGLAGWRIMRTLDSMYPADASIRLSEWYVAWIYPMIYIVVGLAMIFKATKFARVVCAGCYPDGLCQRCGYNLAEAKVSTCPQCVQAET